MCSQPRRGPVAGVGPSDLLPLTGRETHLDAWVGDCSEPEKPVTPTHACHSDLVAPRLQSCQRGTEVLPRRGLGPAGRAPARLPQTPPGAPAGPWPRPCGLGKPRQAVSGPARPLPGELGAGRGGGCPTAPPTFPPRGCGGRGLGSVPGPGGASSATHSSAEGAAEAEGPEAGGGRGGERAAGSRGPDTAGLRRSSGPGIGGRGPGPDDDFPRGRAHSPQPPLPGCAAPARRPASAGRPASAPPLLPPRLYDGARQADASSPEASMAAECRAPGSPPRLLLRLRALELAPNSAPGGREGRRPCTEAGGLG